MFQAHAYRLLGLVLLLVASLTLAACGGETPAATTGPPLPTNAPAPAAAATNTTAEAAPTATTALAAPTTASAAPTTTTAMTAATDTPAAAAPTATTALAAATDTPAAAAPMATTAGTGSGTGSLEQAVANMRALKSYHLDITTSTIGPHMNLTTTLGVDVDMANKKLRLTMDSAGHQFMSIMVGGNTWLSQDGGKTYIASPAAKQTAQSFDSFINIWNTAASAGTPVPGAFKPGTPPNEQIDGVDTSHYIADSKDVGSLSIADSGLGRLVGGLEASDSGTSEYWVSNDSTPTIRQLKVTTTPGGQTGTGILKWSKFNEDLGITAPK